MTTSRIFHCCAAAAVAGLLLSPASVSAQPAASDDSIFRSQVRTTDPLTPAQQQTQFTVPPGFQVTLFASEPDLQKPMNMAFDADGRLWVTGSNEYPMPAKAGEGRDSIRILEDTNGDGAADKVTVFADNLNVPIGLYPYRDGAIVFSIPNILFLRDTDGDGAADSEEVLFGPFDTTRDTHGMNNSFRRGFDGWLYCCHGFNNQSKVAGKDGHAVEMQSGNTYRIRLDGSRIEHFTHGQVNPFGMAIDANGDLWTSDCHTKPVTLLMRGGFYESFGKPHDGLGYVPNVMEHLHGSTAIDGLCQYQGTAFPAKYHDSLFVGNVMTCRVHRNTIVRDGASVSLQEEPDFLVSADPWFRPVDIQTGPDGALYIADFYNRIIGHYEVPLDHPGRDRERGRIWKVSYVGGSASSSANTPSANAPTSAVGSVSLRSAELPELLAALSDARQPVRQHAADQIVDRVGKSAVTAVQAALKSAMAARNTVALPQLLWVLQRLQAITESELKTAFDTGNQRTKIHVQRICSELPLNDQIQELIRRGLREPAGLVQRAAADAAARHPAIELLKEVINATALCPTSDRHRLHALKIALRNQLQHEPVLTWFIANQQPEAALLPVAGVVQGLRGEQVSDLVLALLKNTGVPPDLQADLVRHAAIQGISPSASELIPLVAGSADLSLQTRTEIYTALKDGFERSGRDQPETFQNWSTQLAQEIFQAVDVQQISWGQYSVNQQPVAKWNLEPRLASPDASSKTSFVSSLPAGESAVGVLRSRAFVIPFKLELEICGHLGFPDQPAIPENRIVLRDFSTGAELRSVLAPRNDVATTVVWDLADVIGGKAYLEVVDGINIRSYAWLAVGRILPAVARASDFDSGRNSALLMAAIQTLQAQQNAGTSLSETDVQRLGDVAAGIQFDGAVRALAATTLLQHHQQTDLAAITTLLKIGTTPRTVDAAILEYCLQPPADLADSGNAVSDSPAGSTASVGVPASKIPAPGDSGSGTSFDAAATREQKLLRLVFSELNQQLRDVLIKALAAELPSAELLVASIESGVPSSTVLHDQRLVQQLTAFGPELAERVTQLKATAPEEAADTEQLAATILRRARLQEGSASDGEAIFNRHCRNCHRLAGEGGLVGPQLDGIRTRGLARLLEDVLHPNRNVDVAFRTSVLVLEDGRIVSGLVRESAASQELTVFDTEGKPRTVLKSDVQERRDSALSLMPGNVAKLLKEDELLNLMLWLSR